MTARSVASRPLLPLLVLAVVASAGVCAPASAQESGGREIRLDDRRPDASPEGGELVEDATDEERAWVLPETAELHELRARLREDGVRPGETVGGPALLGVRLAGSRNRIPHDASPRLLAIADGWDGLGAFVLDVVPGSPADFAGLQPGDIVVQYGGIWVDQWDLLVRLASRSRLDREQEVWVLRDDVVVKTWVVPRDRRVFEESEDQEDAPSDSNGKR